MDVDDCFYDELSSFMSSPNDYRINHHDFDEIISSTVSQLDSSLDLNSFLPQGRESLLQGDNLFSELFQTAPDSQHNGLELNFNNLEAGSTQSWNTDDTFFPSSMASMDDSMNVCSVNTEIEKLTRGNLFEQHMHDRDTPSPTESCGSFSGSSTSGVHSDTSDAWQNRQREQLNDTAPSDMMMLLSVPKLHPPPPLVESFKIENEDSSSIQNKNVFQMPELSPLISTSTLNEQQLKEKTSINWNPEIVPQLKEVPITSPTAAATTTTGTTTPSATGTVYMPVNVDAKFAPKVQKPAREKLLIDAPAESAGKTKTIFLSSNDYKALMQKMNLNGAKGGAKINGSVKTQIPKIVMKQANCKAQAQQQSYQQQNVVQAKTQNQSNLLRNHAQHQPIPQSTINRESSLEPEQSSHYIRKSTIDEKMYKKQQRMIKNRQSASLSRKKKKEYVVSLETRLNNLQKENYTLKGENVTLRNQLVALAKTCKCRKGSVCDFVLHSLNSKPAEQNIKIAPKPSSKSFKQHMTAATVKKNVAVLFAMAFMVTLNAGNFQSYLSKHSLEADSNTAASVSDSNVKEAMSMPMPISRRLLWVESEEEYNEKLNRNSSSSSRQAAEELVMPPLHFLRPNSRSSNNATQGGGVDPPPLTFPAAATTTGKCNDSNGNQTEYSRLMLHLEKLINVSGYHNLSMSTKFNMESSDKGHRFKFSTDYLELPDMVEGQTGGLGKRKKFMGGLSHIGHKQQKLDTDKNIFGTGEPDLFKGIKRQDDTFYVLSFNTDHILLSPAAHNKNVRPKMSLLLPTADPSNNGDIMMMQVDCEVFNTKELELKSHMIPARLRPNVTKWQMKPKHSMLNSNNNSNKTLGNIKLQDRMMKPEKPRVRTYFMVGPKNQAAAAVSQEKPRLVEFNKSMVNNSKPHATDTTDYDSRLHG
ncbi:uncharacterized protein LOC6560291 [Drosophila grimshawi]|uniref:GH21728 n=1 Tax=Drosophila grimshawi TaxID=7222 RepID=B4J6G0_DROGR|nr:uncharacterized protein LOC6560291 [Drosophila grimshawi]EDW01961.1 GH21728 [Drosophila grimshawi]